MLTTQEIIQPTSGIAARSSLSSTETKELKKAFEPPPPSSKDQTAESKPVIKKRIVQPETITSPHIQSQNKSIEDQVLNPRKEASLNGTGQLTAPNSQNNMDNGGQSKTIANAIGSPDARNRYLAMVRQTIEQHKRYPQRAVMRGLQGEVGVQFILTQDGTVTGLTIKESSGEKLFDEAALAAVQAATPFPKMPEGLFALNTLLELKIVFALH